MVCRCPSDAIHSSRAAAQSAYSARSDRESHEKEVAKLKAEIFGMIVKPSKYNILEAREVGNHLVMKVLYPNCKNCEYDGTKVMVFSNRTAVDALRWTRIDPHFRKMNPTRAKDIHNAPSPTARFPNTPEGWEAALRLAQGLRGGT